MEFSRILFIINYLSTHIIILKFMLQTASLLLIMRVQLPTIQTIPQDEIKHLPTFFPHSRSCLARIFITIGKKRLLQFLFHADLNMDFFLAFLNVISCNQFG